VVVQIRHIFAKMDEREPWGAKDLGDHSVIDEEDEEHEEENSYRKRTAGSQR
jgi:hypothetical protein